ncbi:MAG: AsmA family protein [Rickettsiales bacterium]|jgi:hypothetical protein|nr:AsmA family protein [Rickettsiales bacterium]
MPYKRRLFFKIARICAMFFTGLVVAVFIALSQVNLETLRGNLLDALRDATGLPVEIDGGISWKFSVRPKIEINGVRVPNADWARHRNGFTAKKVDVTLNLISLLRDKPTIQNARIHDVGIFLEQNDSGEYSMAPAKGQGAEHAKQSKYPFASLGLDEIDVRNVVADIDGKTYVLGGFNVSYNGAKNSEEYTGWFKSDLMVYPFIVSFSEFNEERKVYPMRIALSTGGQALVANIALEGKSKMPIDFIVKGKIPDIVPLGKFLDMEFPKMPTIEVNLAGGLGHKKLTLRKSSIAVKGSDATFSGNVDWSAKVPDIVLKLESGKIDLDEVFPGLYSSGVKWVRPKRDLNVFRDVPLYGGELLNYNLSLTAKVGSLAVYREMVVKDIDLKANLKNGRMRFDMRANFAEGNVRAAADITGSADGMLSARAAGLGERVYVGEIMKSVREDDYISELPVNFEFYVQGRGSNLSELVSTTTGPVYVYSVAPGYAHSELVAYMYGTDFLTDLRHGVQDLFRSKKKYDQIKISCAAANMKLRDGRIETENGVAVETNAVNLRLAGKFNFGAETLKASLTSVPVRGLKLSLTGNVINSMEFSGNLAEPDMKISGSAVAGKVASATGIGLLLAPFTGGLGLVAGAGVGWLAGDLIENWLADDHPCKTAMTIGAPDDKGDPDWLNAPMAELVGGLIN